MKFLEYNANPKQNKTSDCVIRALCIGLSKEWKNVYEELTELGLKKCRLINEPKVYIQYLKNLGYEKQKMPRREDKTRYTLSDFIEEYGNENLTYIISLAKHLTVVSDNTLIDTWDCSNKCVGNYWIIPGKCDIIKLYE